MTGTDANGCVVKETVTVDILCTDFIVPNVFTPDGDGKNDVFSLMNVNNIVLDSYTLTIYDRWGKVMYKTNSFDLAHSWNGKVDNTGGECPDGVYYYIITGVCGTDTYKKDGFVQVIR